MAEKTVGQVAHQAREAFLSGPDDPMTVLPWEMLSERGRESMERAAAAAIAHHEAQRKRPISEAPKDGRAILAVNENGWARVVEWQGNAWFLLGGDCYYMSDYFTHWYELPPGSMY